MDVLITGGGGFLGGKLAQKLIAANKLDDQAINKIVLCCRSVPAKLSYDITNHCQIVKGDINDPKLFAKLVRKDMSIFHLAAVVSGAAEQDFKLAIRTNVTATQTLLECARSVGGVKLVFASSTAVFGGANMPNMLGDDSKQSPQTTYGMTKAIGELLINDYARKGFVDARSARLPTVIVRPGKANLAASSFASAMFREPLAGADYALPVAPDTSVPLIGYGAAIGSLIKIHDLASELIGTNRAIGLPVLNVTVKEMIDCLARFKPKRPSLGKLSVVPDKFITQICATWPKKIGNTRAQKLGLPKEKNLDAIVERYIADYLET